MKFKKKVLIGCLLLTGITAYAQEETTTEKLSLSLEEAKEYALSYNRTIRVSDLNVQKAYKARWQSIATMLPQANATLGYSSFLGHKVNFGGMDIPMNPSGDLTVQATMTVSGLQIVSTQLSKIAIQMSETNKQITELDIKANVSMGYFSVLIAEESKRLIESSKENLTKLYESTAELYEVGMTEQTDVDQLSVQLGILNNTILATERNIEIAYNSLRLLLGSNDIEIELTQSLDDLISQNNPYEVIGTLFDLENDYNVQLLNQNINLSKKQLNMKQWEYGPTLSGYYQYTGKTFFGKSEGLNMNPPHTVGLSLNIPILSSGERLSKVRQAKYDLQAAEINKEDAVEGLLVQEKQLRFNLKSAIETYEIQKKNIEVYDRIFKNTSEKYELGTVSSTDLTTINNNLISEQINYINALMEMLSAQTALQKLINNL